MKIKKKDLVLVAIAVVIIVVIAVFGFQQNEGDTDESVKTDLRIEFGDAAPSLHPGNVTTWTYDDGTWNAQSVQNPNGSETVWVFKDLPSESNLDSQLKAASEAAGFTVGTQTYTNGVFVKMIGGIENELSGAGWQFYVNGVYGNKACNLTPIEDGDQVRWSFEESLSS